MHDGIMRSLTICITWCRISCIQLELFWTIVRASEHYCPVPNEMISANANWAELTELNWCRKWNERQPSQGGLGGKMNASEYISKCANLRNKTLLLVVLINYGVILAFAEESMLEQSLEFSRASIFGLTSRLSFCQYLFQTRTFKFPAPSLPWFKSLCAAYHKFNPYPILHLRTNLMIGLCIHLFGCMSVQFLKSSCCPFRVPKLL